ncbi:MAG: hypothetical protein ACYTDW_13565 [Planctomycetota bacterium]|jgi:hypothetical protein
MKARYFFIIFLLLISGCKKQVGNASGDNANMLTKQEIIEIANKKALSEEFPLDTSKVHYDVDNKEWEKMLVLLKRDYPDDARRLEILEGRDYQAVLYTPKSPTAMGGILWVFIDKKTGEVITLFAEI